MNWIQNDNQNINGVDQHPKAWQALFPFNLLTFYSIKLYIFDSVRLHVEAYLVSVSSSLVLFWEFCTEDV